MRTRRNIAPQAHQPHWGWLLGRILLGLIVAFIVGALFTYFFGPAIGLKMSMNVGTNVSTDIVLMGGGSGSALFLAGLVIKTIIECFCWGKNDTKKEPETFVSIPTQPASRASETATTKPRVIPAVRAASKKSNSPPPVVPLSTTSNPTITRPSVASPTANAGIRIVTQSHTPIVSMSTSQMSQTMIAARSSVPFPSPVLTGSQQAEFSSLSSSLQDQERRWAHLYQPPASSTPDSQDSPAIAPTLPPPSESDQHQATNVRVSDRYDVEDFLEQYRAEFPTPQSVANVARPTPSHQPSPLMLGQSGEGVSPMVGRGSQRFKLCTSGASPQLSSHVDRSAFSPYKSMVSAAVSQSRGFGMLQTRSFYPPELQQSIATTHKPEA